MIALLTLAGALAGVVPVETTAATNAAYAPRRIAVVVGVQDYADPSLAGLRFPDKDAHDLAAVLRDPTIGGFDRVFEIHGSPSTTRDALDRALRVATADLQRDDTFLLYLSGHGTLTLDPLEGSRLWFLPADARLDDPERTGVAVADLEDFVNGLPARRRVLVMDTCHNGRAGSKSGVGTATAQLLQGLRGEVPAPRVDREVAESEARLFAAQYYQPAMEDPTLQNGVYTHFLIEALTRRSDADLDRDGLVDVAEAHEYARDHTIAYTGGLQVPRAEYRIVGREDIYLSGPTVTRTTAERALIGAYDHVLDRARLLVNGTARGELPGLYAVDPGPQTIEVVTDDGRTLLRENVRVGAGDTVGVEALLDRRSSLLEVLGGAQVVGGADLHPVGAALTVGWVRPWGAGGSRLRPDLQLGATWAGGALDDGRQMGTGDLSLGGTAALSLGRAYVGPELTARVPYRVDEATGWMEAGLAGTGGLAAGVAFPMNDRVWLDARADAWGGALPWEGGWEPWWGGGVRVGVGLSR